MNRHVVRHFAEMVAAMVLGMIALTPLWTVTAGWLGLSPLVDRPDVGALVMAVDMTVPMVALMRWRGHGWAATWEMSAMMAVPFLAMVVPWWLGLLSETGLLVVGHVLMLAGMVLAMGRRRTEYAGHHLS